MVNLTAFPLTANTKFEVAPATGSTTAIVAPYNWLRFTNPGTIAAQTVVLPANPVDGQYVLISNTAAITALTLSPVATGAPAGLTAGQGIQLAFSVPNGDWFVVVL